MKKLYLILFCALTFGSSQAQEIWLDAGVKGGYGLTYLINSNISDDNSYSHLLSGSYNIGGKVGVNFGRVHGVTFDAMISRQSQNFEYTKDGVDFENEIDWTNLDLYLLYRASLQGAYLELGPMLSNVRSVDQVDTGIMGGSTEIPSAKSYYNEQYLSAVFGVGGYMAGSDNFTLMVGLRAHYALEDLISDRGQGFEPTPFPATVVPDPSRYTNYADSFPLFVEFMVELNFGIGYFARTTCGGRSKFIGGQGRY